MKTQLHILIPNLKKIVVTLLLASSVFTVGCDKKKDSAPVAVPATPYMGYGGVGCTNCFGNPQLLFGGIQSTSTSGSAQLTMDLLGSTGLGTADWYGLSYYQGVVALQGMLRITAQDPYFCNAMPGDYQLRTLTAGQMSNKEIQGVTLEAIGMNNGYRIVLRMVSKAVLYSPSNQPRMGFTARLDFVNGQACGDAYFY
ncbi:MAG: hypothetical protein BroJett040_10780 [Oligoflexia bacterium]|nr:MAG: hypothetical protein BroJett040_10780 [Oligoflexia bacterium]